MKHSWFCNMVIPMAIAGMIGCSSTYQVGSSSVSVEMSYDDLAKEMADTELTFHFNDSSTQEGQLVQADDDSIGWIKSGEASVTRTATSSCKKIVRKNRILGAVEGGAIAGATYTLLVLALGPPETRHGTPEVSTVEPGWIYATGSAALLAGAVPGALIGHKVEYNFETKTKK